MIQSALGTWPCKRPESRISFLIYTCRLLQMSRKQNFPASEFIPCPPSLNFPVDPFSWVVATETHYRYIFSSWGVEDSETSSSALWRRRRSRISLFGGAAGWATASRRKVYVPRHGHCGRHEARSWSVAVFEVGWVDESGNASGSRWRRSGRGGEVRLVDGVVRC